MNQLCDVVRETSFAIHKYHRKGHFEKVYENALAHRLKKQGLEVKQQHPLTVCDEDGTILGEFLRICLWSTVGSSSSKHASQYATSMLPNYSVT